MIDIRQRLLVVFQAEAKEHLARIRSILGKEGAGTAGANLDEVFRRAHSLKGAARAVDLRIVESLAHPLETLFAKVRDGGLRLEPPVMAVVQQALDGIEEGVGAQLAGKTQSEPTQLLKAINALADAPSAPASARAVRVPISVKAPGAATVSAAPASTRPNSGSFNPRSSRALKRCA